MPIQGVPWDCPKTNLGAGQEVGRSCIILEFKGRKIMMLQVKSSSSLKSTRRGRFCSFLEQYSIHDSELSCWFSL
uniref:Uncharacterized protein n=1 Tax=Anas platyrhynchos platyrhynchos TaxID=8840 RepID=A0A493TL30_ANAPP